MKRTLILSLLATTLSLFASCGNDDPTNPEPDPVPTLPTEAALDPEAIPEQDTDPFPGESSSRSFAISSLIGDNMVVQQNRQLRIWGTGQTGQTVSIKVSWSSKTFTSTVNGRGTWRVRLNVPFAPAGNPGQTIDVTYKGATTSFTGVVIGEVWFCSGQSNMEVTLRAKGTWLGVEDYENVVADAAANYQQTIRMNTITPAGTLSAQWDSPNSGWQTCRRGTAPGFSAVAYFFAKKLVDSFHVPVGLVVSAIGGAPAQAFTPMAALEADPTLKAKYYTPYMNNPSAYVGVLIPSIIYNAMIYPCLNVSMRGMIWYQGEANGAEPDEYLLLIQTMLREWRKGFDQGDIPHYYVQVAPSYWDVKVSNASLRRTIWDQFCYIRETQAKIRDQVTNSEMAVTLDVGDPDDVHPAKKREVGQRLARIALNKSYGNSFVNFCGPRYKSHTITGNKVTVTFDHASGLRTNDGTAPRFFYIAGANKVFYLADAVIKDGAVELSHASVPEPAAVRYAMISSPMTNLENGDGLPAECFRTDNWDPVNGITSTVSYNYADVKIAPPYY